MHNTSSQECDNLSHKPGNRRWSEGIHEIGVNLRYGERPRLEYVEVMSSTPAFLQDLGYRDLPWYQTGIHVMKELSAKSDRGHGFPEDVLSAIPDLLGDPLAVVRSPDRKRDGMWSYVLLLDACDADGLPLHAVTGSPELEFYGQYDANMLLSVYGHDNLYNWFVWASRSGNLVYVDGGRLPAFLQDLGIAVPGELRGVDGFVEGPVEEECWRDDEAIGWQMDRLESCVDRIRATDDGQAAIRLLGDLQGIAQGISAQIDLGLVS